MYGTDKFLNNIPTFKLFYHCIQ